MELNGLGEVVVNDRGQTSVPGLFAAGDMTTTPFKQIVVALGDGAKAARLRAPDPRHRAGGSSASAEVCDARARLRSRAPSHASTEPIDEEIHERAHPDRCPPALRVDDVDRDRRGLVRSEHDREAPGAQLRVDLDTRAPARALARPRPLQWRRRPY